MKWDRCGEGSERVLRLVWDEEVIKGREPLVRARS